MRYQCAHFILWCAHVLNCVHTSHILKCMLHECAHFPFSVHIFFSQCTLVTYLHLCLMSVYIMLLSVHMFFTVCTLCTYQYTRHVRAPYVAVHSLRSNISLFEVFFTNNLSVTACGNAGFHDADILRDGERREDNITAVAEAEARLLAAAVAASQGTGGPVQPQSAAPPPPPPE